MEKEGRQPHTSYALEQVTQKAVPPHESHSAGLPAWTARMKEGSQSETLAPHRPFLGWMLAPASPPTHKCFLVISKEE